MRPPGSAALLVDNSTVFHGRIPRRRPLLNAIKCYFDLNSNPLHFAHCCFARLQKVADATEMYFTVR
jgi:hypothetical protein